MLKTSALRGQKAEILLEMNDIELAEVFNTLHRKKLGIFTDAGKRGRIIAAFILL